MSLNFERKIIDFFSISKQLSHFCLFFALFCAISAPAQTKQQRYLDYIERYKAVALQHERDYGVPASITLAQGILESSVGQSKMAQEANNHFGIKAYHWKGEVYGRCDSLNQVGYRVYGAPEDSFIDHAKFLKGPRYSILYEFDVKDYRSWAQGLRDCGYAEDANYPAKLINIIEQYELYALDGGKRLDAGREGDQREEVETLLDEDEKISARERRRLRAEERKRRRAQQQQQQVLPQERQQAYTPLRQGSVPSSADND